MTNRLNVRVGFGVNSRHESFASYDAREKLTTPCDASKTSGILVRQHSCTDAGLYDVVVARVVPLPLDDSRMFAK